MDILNIIAEVRKVGAIHFIFLLCGLVVGFILGMCLGFVGHYHENNMSTAIELDTSPNYHFTSIPHIKDVYARKIGKLTQDPKTQSYPPYGCKCDEGRGKLIPSPNGGLNSSEFDRTTVTTPSSWAQTTSVTLSPNTPTNADVNLENNVTSYGSTTNSTVITPKAGNLTQA